MIAERMSGPTSARGFSADVVDADAFWALVDRSGECWLWAGAGFNPGGYGVLQVPRFRSTPVNAHRVAYVLANGSIPDGVCVLHECDNPPCVNPAHLHAGTHADNMAEVKSRPNRVRRRVLKQFVPDGSGWTSALNACLVLGDSMHRVLDLIIRGVLVGKRCAGRVVVTDKSLCALVESRKANAATDALVTAQDGPEHSRQNVANGLGAGDESRAGG